MKLAIITGASSGIGLALARRLIASEYQVATLSRRPSPVSGVKHIRTDLASHGFFDTIVDELMPIVQKSTEVTLVHNASRYLNDDSTNMDDDALRDVIQVNVLAPHTLNRNILPHMGPGSSVIYVGSTLSEKAVKGCFSYVTTKHAQIGMMRALCQDLVGRQIHTACICPGFTDTEMLRSHVPDENLQQVAELSTFGRLIQPDEIADTIQWAINSPVVNGSVLHANLGQIET